MAVNVEFTPVKSSNIKAVGHLIGMGLYVDFHNGRRYRYPDAPSSVHDALVAESKKKGGSVGRAFQRLVKDAGFSFEEVSGVEE